MQNVNLSENFSISKCLYCDTIANFLVNKNNSIVKSMCNKYLDNYARDPSSSEVSSWLSNLKVMKEVLKKLVRINPDYSKLHIILEYFIPLLINDLNNQSFVRTDMIIISKRYINLFEFKNIILNNESLIYPISQVKKYVRRLKRHKQSMGLKIRPFVILTAQNGFKINLNRVRCWSSDIFINEFSNIMEHNPVSLDNINDWMNSDYQ